jgi:hypothetical protein
MTLTSRSLAASLLLIATTISMTFQLARSSAGTNPDVDTFGIEAAIAYAVLYVVALAGGPPCMPDCCWRLWVAPACS